MRILRSPVAGAAAATLVTLALATPASAHTAPDPADPASYDFSDCPALPAGLDPTGWLCEVHLATGRITFGDTTISDLPMRLVHAEGPLPDGTTGQVFGTLGSGPAATHGLVLRMRSGGYADLVGNGPDPGGIYLRLAVRGPGLGRHCTVGTMADPIRTHAAPITGTTTIPTDPPIRQFMLRDTTFTVPAASGCAGHDRRVDARLGLPAPAGNTLTLQVSYTYRMYSTLTTDVRS